MVIGTGEAEMSKTEQNPEVWCKNTYEEAIDLLGRKGEAETKRGFFGNKVIKSLRYPTDGKPEDASVIISTNNVDVNKSSIVNIEITGRGKLEIKKKTSGENVSYEGAVIRPEMGHNGPGTLEPAVFSKALGQVKAQLLTPAAV
jgi:hypothetical protein